MNPDLEKAFCGVYFSSREIVRNKQHHLFCNMLDLLTSTCKATSGALVSTIAKDEQISFWCNDILPLVFDSDMAVQSSAISALEQGVLKLDTSLIQSSTYWPSIRSAIIADLRPRVDKLREQGNRRWHHIWCLLVRLLDRDILKNASTMNSFLAIVELGFRSSEVEVRIEAFTSWRLLIKLFFEHGEIFNAKRLKLISIPLKSSQAKTPEMAVVKFRVWWYLLTCLGSRLVEFFDPVVECFLVFCFGTRSRNTKGAAQQFAQVRELVLPCWATLLTATGAHTPNTLLERNLHELQLEPFAQFSPLVEFAAMGSHRQMLVDATLEAVNLLLQSSDSTQHSEATDYILELLMRYLIKPMLCLDEPAFSTQICRELIKFLPAHSRPVVFAINCIATEGLQWYKYNNNANVDDYADVMESLMQLLTAGKAAAVPRAILQRCVGQVYSLKVFGSGRSQWRALGIVLDLITESMLSTADNDLYELRMLVWQHVTGALLDYLAENTLDCRLKEYSTVLYRWSMWPLGYYAAHARAATCGSFDAAFCTLWRRLLNAGQNAPDRQEFLSEVTHKLQSLLPLTAEDSYFGELLNSYAVEVMKLDNVKNMSHYRQLFTLIKSVIVGEAPMKAFEASLIVLRMMITSLKDDELQTLMDEVKLLVTHVNNCSQKQALNKSFFTEWKHAIQQRLRAHSNKSISVLAAELFKSNDVFVVIPSVWSLNPDKLTDHQKERFRKKTADIPALYNDMSQSQESSSIKPWTPNKIVVSKDDETKVVIEQQPEEATVKEVTVKEAAIKEATIKEAKVKEAKVKEATIKEAAVKEASVKEAVGEEDKQTQQIATPKVTTATKRNKSERKRPVRQSMRSQRKPIAEANNNETKTPVVENAIKENEPINGDQTKIVESNDKSNETLIDDINLVTTDSFCIPVLFSNHVEINNDTINIDEVKSDEDKVIEVKDDKDKSDELQNDQIHIDEVKIVVANNDGAKSTEVKISAENLDASEKIETSNAVKDIATEPALHELLKTLDDQSPIKMFKEQTINVDKEQNTIAVYADIVDQKIMSPKRTITKYTPLSSPPDRKLTNNSTSPTLRPKPSAHLTGRGAQLINMIRNKKVDLTSNASGTINTQSATKSCLTPIFSKTEKSLDVSSGGSAIEQAFDVPIEPEHTSTPVQCRELLVFSRTLPSLGASPSTSILKRKMRCDSLDDVCVESPMHKRKRVSFHDPPVSVTKEYLRDVDENKSKLKRCLNMDKVGSETKHALKRQNKLYNIAQIETYTNERQEKMDTTHNTFNSENTSKIDWIENCKLQEAIAPAPLPLPLPLPQTSNDLSLFDAEILLNFVVQNHTMETLLDKYFEAENTSTPKLSNVLAKYLSGYMTANPKMKTNVLEVLSENHSKDFLDHAIQENLSSVVCDRLNLNAVIDYICAKSKINASCRSNLLLQLPEIFKQCKGQKERIDCIKQQLQSTDLTDSDILEFITLLIQKRSTPNCKVDVSVSESAVDSSSNL